MMYSLQFVFCIELDLCLYKNDPNKDRKRVFHPWPARVLLSLLPSSFSSDRVSLLHNKKFVTSIEPIFSCGFKANTKAMVLKESN